MTRNKKIVVGVLAVAGLAAVVAANLAFQPSTGVEVTTEAIAARDLEAIVTSSLLPAAEAHRYALQGPQMIRV